MSNERAMYDGDLAHLDEIVAHGVDLHIEQMDAHGWTIIATRPATDDQPAVEIHLYAYNLTEVQNATGLPVVMHPEPLLLCSEWHDSKGFRHWCTRTHRNAGAFIGTVTHRCECGAQKQGLQ